MRDTIRTLWDAFGRYRYHVTALVVLAVISPLLEGIGINAVIPLMSFFLGGVSSEPDFVTRTIQGLFAIVHVPFTFRYLLGFIFVLFVVRAISVVSFGYIRGWVNADYLSKESEDIMRRALRASWSFSLKQKLGTIHNTLVRDVQQTSNLLGAAVQSLQSFSGFLMYLLIAVNISPVMTGYAIGGGAVLLVVLRPLLRKTQRIGRDTAGVEKQFAQFLTEHIIGMKAVKAAGVERPAIATGASQIHQLRDLSIRQSFISTISSSFFQPFSMVLVVLLLLLTYHAPGFSIISFVATLYLIQKIFAYLESGQNSLQSMSGLLPYVKNVAAFKKQLDEHRELLKGNKPFRLEKALEVRDVSFSYTEGQPVLSGIQFSLHAGETVGIVGPSGAGKTSIADLLLRLFTPSSGMLLIDGVSSEEIPLDEWRRHIGYVSQDVFLLNSSIKDNIRFYNDEVTDVDIENAARQANIYDFIEKLPDGFQTVTGDRGVMLSGGQRQRIALARALASKPSLLILDEATSALDHESERLIHDSIRALHGAITVCIIAHRPSTVAEADNIIVLGEGKVIESGTPEELLHQPSSYFYRMQHA